MSSIVPPPIRHKICSKRRSPGLGNTTFCLRCAAFFITRRFCAAPFARSTLFSDCDVLSESIAAAGRPSIPKNQGQFVPSNQCKLPDIAQTWGISAVAERRGTHAKNCRVLDEQVLNRLRLSEDRNVGTRILAKDSVSERHTPPRLVRKP